MPNCRGSICLSTAGLTKRSTTISSANLERIDVREIGRRCLFTSRTGVNCVGKDCKVRVGDWVDVAQE